jgi:hypothetical protein
MPHEVTANLLDEWRGKWDPDAVEPENRMASNTQSFLLTRTRSFFRWAHAIKLRDDNPTLALASIDRKQDETLPLTPNQFDELIAATKQYDAEKRREYDRIEPSSTPPKRRLHALLSQSQDLPSR